MNLIEQFGGYEKAKEVVLGKPETSTHYNLNSLGGHYAKEGVLKLNHRWKWFNTIDKQWYWDFSESNHIEIHDIKKALLKYRRQHNIFEIDDYVVYQGDSGLSGLFRIEKLTKTGKPKSVKTNRFGGFPCRYCEVRHATDEEIKAGHRL